MAYAVWNDDKRDFDLAGGCPLTDADRIAAGIVREVAELPDRTSPEYAPDMMLVSADELRAIVLAALNQS